MINNCSLIAFSVIELIKSCEFLDCSIQYMYLCPITLKDELYYKQVNKNILSEKVGGI